MEIESLIQTVAPTLEPVPLEDVLAQCRVTDHSEDSLVAAYIAAARRYVERALGRQLVTATYTYSFDYFPAESWFELPRPPLQSVTSIIYADSAGTATTLSGTTVYGVDSGFEPGRVYLRYNQVWPVSRGGWNDVVVTYKAGYGASGCTAAASRLAVPETCKQAIRYLAANWFDRREPIVEGIVAAVPVGSMESLLSIEDWGDY